MEKTEEEVIWSRSNGSLFEDFAISLEEYTKTGKAPAEGDQDIQYGLELQDERLQKVCPWSINLCPGVIYRRAQRRIKAGAMSITPVRFGGADARCTEAFSEGRRRNMKIKKI